MSIDTSFILKVFRHEYRKRLNEVIGEADVFNDAGDVILSRDLKVRHKPSGLEYTIDKIEGEQGDEVKIYMRPPEAPRFEPPAEEVDILGEPKNDAILGEQDPSGGLDVLSLDQTEDLNDEPEEVVFVIDQKEFEKDYEVD